MSGPKTSSYYLTAEQRAILLEQARLRREALLREQRAKKEFANIEENKKILRSEIIKIDKIIEKIRQIQAETGENDDTLEEAKVIRETAIKRINHAASLNEKSELTVLRNENHSFTKCTSDIRKVEYKLSAVWEKMDKCFREETGDKINKGFQLSFYSSQRVNDEESILMDRIKNTLNNMDFEFCPPSFSIRFGEIQHKITEIKDYDFLKNYYAMTIIPFEKECAEYKQAYLKYGEEFEELIAQYHLLSDEAGILPTDIQFSGSAISELKSMIKELEEQMAYKNEQAYISDCLDEAMQEMGYQMVGTRSVTKKSGRTFKNELYLFDEGAVVNVTYSGEGQITMELGGVDTEDRIATENECRNLADDMRAFCDDYYEIERRLRKKGIVTKKISILPPDEEYAQIINVSDYNVLTTLEKYEEHRDRKQNVSQKRLHKEG